MNCKVIFCVCLRWRCVTWYEDHLWFNDHVQSFMNPILTSSGRSIIQRDLVSENGSKTIPHTNKPSPDSHDKIWVLLRSFPPAVLPEHHPCENFSQPPPPTLDRRHIGRWRKATISFLLLQLSKMIQILMQFLHFHVNLEIDSMFSCCVACPVCCVPVE